MFKIQFSLICALFPPGPLITLLSRTLLLRLRPAGVFSETQQWFAPSSLFSICQHALKPGQHTILATILATILGNNTGQQYWANQKGKVGAVLYIYKQIFPKRRALIPHQTLSNPICRNGIYNFTTNPKNISLS